MEKWEYCAVTGKGRYVSIISLTPSGLQERKQSCKPGEDHAKALAVIVAQLGLEGWEAISSENISALFNNSGHGFQIYFKRPIKN